MKPVEFLKLYFAVMVGGKCFTFTPAVAAPLTSISWLIGVAKSNSAEIYPWIEFSRISGVLSENEAHEVNPIGISLEDQTLTILKQST